MMTQEIFNERKERKIERYTELAEKSLNESIARRKQSDRMAEMIPFGQPILVGHHSEGMHRRHIEKIQNNMFKSFELSDKADYYNNKVEAIKNNTAISSDNPQAIQLLTEKLANLEKERNDIKEFNKNARKNKTDQKPSFYLSNLAGNIATVKKRIEHLQRLSKVVTSEIIINGITIKIDSDENRVKILFPSIPDEKVRSELKSNGFRWSPYNKAWQRQISDWAISQAKRIIGGENEKENN